MQFATDIIYNCDAADGLRWLPDQSIDLVATSPPYDSLRKYGQTDSLWNSKKFEEIALELIRVLKEGGIIVWVVNDAIENGGKTLTSFNQCLYFCQNGLKLNDTMIWRKTNPLPQVRQPRYAQCFEYMFVFSKGNPKTFNPIMRKTKCGGQSYNSTAKNMGGENGRRQLNYNVNKEAVDYNIWEIAIAPNKKIYNVNGKEIKHPAVFPYEIPYRHILTWANEGDVVLDPFAGSGTTLVASKDLKRKYIGIEIVQDYCEIIKENLKENDGTK